MTCSDLIWEFFFSPPKKPPDLKSFVIMYSTFCKHVHNMFLGSSEHSLHVFNIYLLLQQFFVSIRTDWKYFLTVKMSLFCPIPPHIEANRPEIRMKYLYKGWNKPKYAHFQSKKYFQSVQIETKNRYNNK